MACSMPDAVSGELGSDLQRWTWVWVERRPDGWAWAFDIGIDIRVSGG